MKTHIEETIRDLSAEIARLQDTINLLHKLGGEAPVGPTAAAPVAIMAKPALQPTRAQKSKPRGGGGTPAGHTHQMRELSAHIVEAAARLDQPFGPKDVAKAAGITLRMAYGYLNRWKTMYGWVRSLGKASYERTAKFGGGDKPAAPAGGNGRTSIPGLDKETKSVEEQIQEAIKQRDRARTGGQETLTRIYQDKIDKLQLQLDK